MSGIAINESLLEIIEKHKNISLEELKEEYGDDFYFEKDIEILVKNKNVQVKDGIVTFLSM